MYKNPILRIIVSCVLLLAAGFCSAQGTAFTYQGLLSNTNEPVNGSYDMTFKLFNGSSGGTQVGSTVTDSALSISNGYFTVVLDFGSQFNGTTYWLELGVRSNGVGSFITLAPRQELTPAPYAITAENVDGSVLASQLIGTLPSGLLSGIYSDPLTLNNSANIIDGNGSGLTGVNALTLGGLGASSFWQTTGNAGTTAGPNFVGTTDGAALELASSYFVGVNRTVPVTGADVFSITSPATNGYGGMYVDTAGAQGWPFYGYSLAGDDVAWTFIDGSYLNTWFLYNSGYWLTVETNGSVGIDNTSPLSPLDVGSGNHWDVFNPSTYGDFRVGGDGVGLKLGVATGGAGAGDVRVFAFGGTGRLILGSGTNDGVITVTNNLVGINTLTPYTDTTLTVESTNFNGLYVYTSGVSGNGIYAEADYGGNAYGVEGVSDSGVGVVGTSYGGFGIGVWGATADPSGTGVLADGASISNAALTIDTGYLRVAGAGTNTSTTAFVQITTTDNVFGDSSYIDNPICNDDPNAILIITPNWNPGNSGGAYSTEVVGVWYDGLGWALFNESTDAMAVGLAYNVLIIKN